jgi:hypothetical protein
VSIIITNMTAEATTTIATTGTKLDAVDTTDAVMAENRRQSCAAWPVRPGSRLGLDARRRRGDLLIKIRGNGIVAVVTAARTEWRQPLAMGVGGPRCKGRLGPNDPPVR